MKQTSFKRQLPIGAEPLPDGGTHFRVWAPKCKVVEVVLENDKHVHHSLDPEGEGYFSGIVDSAKPGSLYRFRLNKNVTLYPDPASRWQPEGPHGPSEVIDPTAYAWKDKGWKGVTEGRKILYEMHIGTYTEEGTWNGTQQHLFELAEMGINVIEMMPINGFPGRFGWGYDGVNMFSPAYQYGTPDDLKSFIDHAHSLGIAVILDVVYNHFGPDGCYLRPFSDDYFTEKGTEWGDAINFHSKPVREFYIANAHLWVDEYHFDGLRFDAIQSIFDDFDTHIIREIHQDVRKKSGGRRLYLIAENDKQEIQFVSDPAVLDGVWNDDFHHTAIARLTGHNEAYYMDFLGTPQEFISAAKYGYLYQGQWYVERGHPRGTSNLDLDPSLFIHFLQNHDQVANSAHGLRIHQLSDPGNYRAMTALLLLGPNTPMLFQGQEFAASTPFLYFADHEEDLSKLVFEGRRSFLKQFPTINHQVEAQLDDPSRIETFERCKLKHEERKNHREAWALHQDLIQMSLKDALFSRVSPVKVDGAVLSNDAFLLRFYDKANNGRLLLINFGLDLNLSPAPHPLLAPPQGTKWEFLWCSEELRYGGKGFPLPKTDEHWRLLGHAATVFTSKKL